MKLKHAAFFLLSLSTLALRAEEGGAGHYVPGNISTLIDLPPTKEGWVFQSFYLHYDGEISASQSFPVAGLVAAGLNATSDAYTVGGAYTFQTPLLGAHYSVAAYLPYVWMDVSASLTTPLGTLNRSDSADGFGDLTFIPVMMAWKKESWQFNALLPIYAPTGDYTVGRLANPGRNYWTFDPTIGLSYNNQKTGFNFALYSGITLNTENNDTDYQSGSVIHTEASMQQLLPLGKGFLGIGANAFLYEQVTGDSGSGARLGAFEGRTLGVGPALSYVLPIGDKTLAAEIRWLPELETKNRTEGNFIWVKLAYQF